jgi:hypothetical protein
MLPVEREVLRGLLTERMDKHRAQEEMTQAMLRRSRDAVTRSYELLAQPVPHVWHPEPPKSGR